MGSAVHLIEMMPGLLPGEDDAAVRTLQSSFEKRGIKLYLGKKVTGVEFNGDNKKLLLDDGSYIEVNEALVSAGRTAQLQDLGLDKLGLEWDRKGIKVDDRLRTKVSGIYAIGDVNGLSLLAHAATIQGEIAAENVMGASEAYDNSLIPKCIYSWPEIASVGLNKKEAEAKGIQVKVKRSFFLSSGRAMTQDDTEGFVQVVTEFLTDRIIGAQIAGGPATEIIHVFSVAIRARMTAKELSKTVFAHPTMAETIHEALVK